MAKYRLTEEMVYKIEHQVMGDIYTSFEVDEKPEDILKLAAWKEGVRDMAIAVVDAIKELEKV